MSDGVISALIVDDSPDDAELIEDTLGGIKGYVFDIVICTGALSAVSEARRKHFQLVLVDYNMPGNDGLWLLSELQNKYLDTAIIFLTGSGSERVAVEALKKGATDYLCKNEITAESLGKSISYSLKRKSEDLEFLYRVTRDSLTGVMSRFSFLEVLEQTVKRCGRNQNRFALLFIDLDKFKPVNDQYGHLVGDQVLVDVSRRIWGCLRKCDTLARMGGDEFVVLVEDIAHGYLASNLSSVANRVFCAITDEFYSVPELNLKVGASIGVAIYPASGQSAKELLTAADEAMYECKKAQVYPFVFHDSCARFDGHYGWPRLKVIDENS